jgi:hypothetical protein
MNHTLSPAVSTMSGPSPRSCATPNAGNLFSHGTPMLDPSQVARADTLMVEFMADCAIPFAMADRKSWHRLTDQIRPGVSQ